jgi:hypothetical protein
MSLSFEDAQRAVAAADAAGYFRQAYCYIGFNSLLWDRVATRSNIVDCVRRLLGPKGDRFAVYIEWPLAGREPTVALVDYVGAHDGD